MKQTDIGHVRLESLAQIQAGAYCTAKLVYTTGHPIDDSGYLKIAFRYAGDFGTPQFDQPNKPNYCTVTTTGDCRIVPRWDPKGHTRPWGKSLFLKVTGGYLDRDDTVTITFGNTTEASPGWQMQTFCEDTFELKTLVDPIATYQFNELVPSPTFEIIPGKPAYAVCITPSLVQVDTPFFYHLKLEDQWGNPTGLPTRLKHEGFTQSGVQRITQTDAASGLTAMSNPIEVVAALPALQPYWADFHGQSQETIGTNTIDDYFTFARDMALLDIAGHQGNDFQITDAFWDKIKQSTADFNESDRFVTYPSFEWSGNTPLGGDRNVYFLNDKGNITRSSNALLPNGETKYPVSTTANDLFANLRTQQEAKPFCFAHVGGRYADIAMHDQELELAVEAHSAWGTFEWIISDAMERGYRVGICANSDGHKGRPGASYPGASGFGSYGGLTCVLADRLDQQSIYDALKARHFYGTTGNRSLLNLRVVTAAGEQALMGDVIDLAQGTATLQGQVIGTAPIERIDLCDGKQIFKTIRPYSQATLGSKIKILWSGAEVRGRARRVDWTGGLTVANNQILNVEPINFHNPSLPLRQIDAQNLQWNSITTGGHAGCVLQLEDAQAGSLTIKTTQGTVTLDVGSIGFEPTTQPYGGVAKQISLLRLPDESNPMEMTLDEPLSEEICRGGVVYLRMTQVDGHIAWSSPFYFEGAK
ncbi:DUF3604 domain-containing protein [bacterium AH-315-I18]|nr:hypothetical protein [Phycisphaeraceae bacterium]MBN4060909.1 DUF3604 domain-containing protein [bacterium AH-315-I18]